LEKKGKEEGICEVPLLKSSIRKDDKISNHKLRDLLEKRREKRATTINYCLDVLTELEPFFCLSNPVLLGSVLKHVASAKLESESAEAKINAAGNRDATNFEVFENSLMVDVANLLLLGQIWRVTETIHRNQRKSFAKEITSKINRKIIALGDIISCQGKFVPISLQKLVKMQLGSILIISDVLSNE
jgi:hypothetical protein